MAFEDPEEARRYWAARAAAEHRWTRIGELLRGADRAETAGDYPEAAACYEAAARLAPCHDAGVFRTLAARMRRLARNGGDRRVPQRR